MNNDDMMKRVVMMSDSASREIAESASRVDTPPCFSCGSAAQSIGITAINIHHSESGEMSAALNILCRACTGQFLSNMTATSMTTGESVATPLLRAAGLDALTTDPTKMS